MRTEAAAVYPWADALRRRVDHIDCMVNTHIHEDHTCGLAAAAELWPPRELWQTLPPNFYETAMYRLDTQQARTPSQGKFLRALNDYQLLCRKTREHGGVIRCLRAGAWMELCPGLRCQVLSPSAARADELESRCKDQFAERDPQAFLRKLDALGRPDEQLQSHAAAGVPGRAHPAARRHQPKRI